MSVNDKLVITYLKVIVGDFSLLLICDDNNVAVWRMYYVISVYKLLIVHTIIQTKNNSTIIEYYIIMDWGDDWWAISETRI